MRLFLATLFEDETLDVTDELVVRGEVFGSVEDKELQFLVETRLAFRINHNGHGHFLLGTEKLDDVVDPLRVLVLTPCQHRMSLGGVKEDLKELRVGSTTDEDGEFKASVEEVDALAIEVFRAEREGLRKDDRAIRRRGKTFVGGERGEGEERRTQQFDQGRAVEGAEKVEGMDPEIDVGLRVRTECRVLEEGEDKKRELLERIRNSKVMTSHKGFLVFRKDMDTCFTKGITGFGNG